MITKYLLLLKILIICYGIRKCDIVVKYFALYSYLKES